MRQKISTKPWCPPPPLIHKNCFATRNFLKHRSKGFLYEIFRQCDTKSWQKIVILPPTPLIHKVFRHQKLWEKKGSPTKFFGNVRQKNWQKIVILSHPAPLPQLKHNFIRHQKFWEKKGSPTKFFGTVRQQTFYRKMGFSPLSHNVCRYPKFSETQTGSSTKLLGTLRRFLFNGKSWYPSAWSA